MKRLYVAVTADRYELPMYVTETRKEMAEYLGITDNTLGSLMTHKCVRKKPPLKNCRFIRVEVEDD